MTVHQTSKRRPATRPPSRRIGGIDILAVGADEAAALVRTAVVNRTRRIFAFCNAHTANMARTDPAFAAVIRRATVFNDGVGIDIAGRVLHGAAFPANLNGTDLTPVILAALPAGTRVFLVGSAPGVAERALRLLAERHEQVRFVGAADGFFGGDGERALARRIKAAQAELVLVGMGHPRQELWAGRNLATTGAVMLCIGAFFDFTAGVVPRAPRWMRTMRVEWAYRLLKEPRRMARRYLIGNAAFLIAVAREKIAAGRG